MNNKQVAVVVGVTAIILGSPNLVWNDEPSNKS